MQTKITTIIAVVFTTLLVSCGVDYKKTKSGIVYKIFPGGGKDSVAGKGHVVKFNFIRKLNDSLLYTSYGKMPGFQQWTDDPGIVYSPLEVLFMMKKGDSAVVFESADTLIKKGLQQQIPFAKKGDQIRTYIKMIEIFRVDSIAQKDYQAEMAKDQPRQQKEMEEAQAKQAEEVKKQKEKELEELKSSGELQKQQKEVEDYLAAKKITATKTPGGTYVLIKEKGTGEPATNGKYVTVKYAGRLLANDSLFQANEYIFPLGQAQVVQGWDDGIALFNEGGKGTLYIPAYSGYGKQPGPGGKPNEALVFDIEVLNVSDTQQQAYNDKKIADSLTAAKTAKKTK
jgi:FKBP-type peptidyl-prolyl cis-trans isomerase